MKQKIKIMLCLCALLLVMFLTGCGAEVSTKMTVDSKFAGTRDIYVTVSNEDLDSVTGGFAALEQVAAANIPENMTYVVSYGEGTSILCFSIAYDSLEDYKDKVEGILAVGLTGEDAIVPEVIFEKEDTYFKEGLKFSENFDSIDLLKWYENALATANIISESQSDWYEQVDGVFVLDGTEYESSSYEYEIDEQKRRCLDSIDVTTTISEDGTFEREFRFEADEELIDELKEVDCDLESYLKKLCPKDDEFTVEKNDYGTNYTIKISADSLKKLVKKTNDILQTENSLAFKAKLNKKKDGVADIVVTESLDGSYYLDYDGYSALSSRLKVYNDVEISDGDGTEYDVDENGIYYYPTAGGEHTFKGTWKIGFGSVKIAASAKNTKKMEISFEFTAMEGLDKELNAAARSVIEKAAKDTGKFSGDEEKYKVSFSGKLAEVTKDVNKFISSGEKDKDYFEVKLYKFNTKSRFSKGICGDMYYNLEPLIGNSDVKFKGNVGLFSSEYYMSSYDTMEEEKEVTRSSEADVTFYTKNVSLLAIVLLVVFIVIMLFGVIFAIANRKEFANIIPYIKSLQKPKVAVVAEQTPMGVPVEETPAEETPIEESTAEETPVEESPAEETSAEETPAEEIPVEEVPAEETSAEEVPAEEVSEEEEDELL